MTIREIRFDGFSPVAILEDGTFDTFDAHRFDAVIEDARLGVIDLDNTFHIELDDADDDLGIDVDDDALALADDDDFDDEDAYFGDGFDLRIDPDGWTSTVFVGY